MKIEFRLRYRNKIVGYEKWYTGAWSKDEYWIAEPKWLYSNDNEKWSPNPWFRFDAKDQWTGLCDQNKVKVYEGDILKTEYDDNLPKPFREIKFHQGAFVASVIGEYGEAHPWPLELAINLHGKVIGNIYETPNGFSAHPDNPPTVAS